MKYRKVFFYYYIISGQSRLFYLFPPPMIKWLVLTGNGIRHYFSDILQSILTNSVQRLIQEYEIEHAGSGSVIHTKNVQIFYSKYKCTHSSAVEYSAGFTKRWHYVSVPETSVISWDPGLASTIAILSSDRAHNTLVLYVNATGHAQITYVFFFLLQDKNQIHKYFNELASTACKPV